MSAKLKDHHNDAESPSTRPDVLAAAGGVLLGKLTPLLKALSKEELDQIPVIAAERAQRPGGGMRPSRFRRAERPQPIEVVFIRDNREIIGTLLLRGKWMERAFAENCNAEVQQAEMWPQMLADACQTWLDWLPHELSRALPRQAAFLPIGLDVGLLPDWDDESFGRILELLEDSTPEEFGRWLSVPVVLQIVQAFARDDEPDHRKRGRAILQKWTRATQGRRKKAPAESSDVMIAEKVAEAERALERGWDAVHANGASSLGDLLLMGYGADEARVLLDGHHRKLRGAAISLVARRLARPPESISVQASRGDKHRTRE